MTQIDYDRELVMAVAPENDPGALCAVAHLAIDPEGETAEFAVLVHHEHAGAGLGRLLMEELLRQGRRRGHRQIHGDVLRQNVTTLGLARQLGFVCLSHDDDPGYRRVQIDLLRPLPSTV